VTDAQRIQSLEKTVDQHRRLMLRLARSLYNHARTDVAPDACLPTLERLIEDCRKATRPSAKRPGRPR